MGLVENPVFPGQIACLLLGRNAKALNLGTRNRLELPPQKTGCAGVVSRPLGCPAKRPDVETAPELRGQTVCNSSKNGWIFTRNRWRRPEEIDLQSESDKVGCSRGTDPE